MSWSALFHLGDLSLTLPAGGAIAAWLLAARAWRAALGWSLVFGVALALVAATKIAFLGWAVRLPALDYKAVSGHAAGFTTVFPTLTYLLLRRCGASLRLGATAAALALGTLVAAALVHAGEHTAAEAIAGWLIGAAASLCAIHLASDVATPPAGRAILFCTLAFGAIAWALRSAPLGWWMIKVALVLSGNARPSSWDHCG
jgi:riboflavin transporter FmnP